MPLPIWLYIYIGTFQYKTVLTHIYILLYRPIYRICDWSMKRTLNKYCAFVPQ